MRKLILSVLLVLASSSAYAAFLPAITPVAGINPAAGFVQLVISVPGSTVTPVTLTSANGGLTCSGTIPRNCNITFPASCSLPSTGTQSCRQVGDFDIFQKAATQVAVVLDGSTHSVRIQNLMIVRRRGVATVNDIKFEVSTSISKTVSTGVTHGFKLVGTFYRTLTPTGSSAIPIVAQAVPQFPSLVAAKAQVSGSYVYIKDNCNSNPVPATTTCQGGKINYNTGIHTVPATSFTDTAKNGIKLGVPILILDQILVNNVLTPFAAKCSDAFSSGNCLGIDHSRLAVTFTLSKPTTILNPTSATLSQTGCSLSNDPCTTLDRVEITASGAGYSGQTEEIVFLGTGLLAEPHQSGNPGDSGKIMFKVFGTDTINTNSCECLNPAATLSPGLNGVPATAVQGCTYNQDFNNDGKPDLFVKFDQNDLAFACTDFPMATYVLSMFCTVNVTAEEATTDKKNIIITDVSGPISGYVSSEGQLPITPCN